MIFWVGIHKGEFLESEIKDMDAIKKQASKLREQVAKQQQVQLVSFSLVFKFNKIESCFWVWNFFI